jgi:KTSC domain
MTAVQSSNLAAIDYDWSGTLTIAFHSGGVYEFYRVPSSEYDGLMNAGSHGKYFHAHIKGRYSYRKIAG